MKPTVEGGDQCFPPLAKRGTDVYVLNILNISKINTIQMDNLGLIGYFCVFFRES